MKEFEKEEAVSIPYFIHEGEMSRLERVNKRLWIFLLVIFLAFVGTNAGWIIYENQFTDISQVETYSAEGEGIAIANREGGVTLNGYGSLYEENEDQSQSR